MAASIDRDRLALALAATAWFESATAERLREEARRTNEWWTTANELADTLVRLYNDPDWPPTADKARHG